MKTIYFGEPNIGKEEINAIIRVIKSKWIGFGKVSIEFERRLTQYVGARDGAVLSSCTAALHLALILNGVKPGDEIITTPLTFAATANTIEYTGARPVFADIRPGTLNIDEDLIENKITTKTRGILVVHFGGLPCNMRKINAIARKHKLFVVEDAAHALGAEYYGKKIGNSKNLTCFSFYANKNLTTNEGGFLCANSVKPIERAKILRLHGLSRNAWNRFKDKSNLSFEVAELGYKYNITDIQSAMGLAQLKNFARNLNLRERYAKLYDEILGGIDGVRLQDKFSHPKIRHALHLYTIAIDPKKFRINRGQLVQELRKRGIFAVVHYKPLHLHQYYKEKYGFRRGDCPVAERMADNILTLPLLPQLSHEASKKLAETVRNVLFKQNI